MSGPARQHEPDVSNRWEEIAMLGSNLVLGAKAMLLAEILAGGIFVSPPRAQSPAKTASRYQPNRFAGRAGEYYRLVWGVESLSVKSAESGEVIRFNYRVLTLIKPRRSTIRRPSFS